MEKRLFRDGPELAKTGHYSADHNRASGAILLVYGETRICLMADAEAPLWRDWLESAPSDLLRPVHFLKVAHHGSANGYLDTLYDRLSTPEQTVAVVTPL